MRKIGLALPGNITYCAIQFSSLLFWVHKVLTNHKSELWTPPNNSQLQPTRVLWNVSPTFIKH